ncbi:MAG: hypothetical protein U1E35_00920 [Rhodospirillales bacterium]
MAPPTAIRHAGEEQRREPLAEQQEPRERDEHRGEVRQQRRVGNGCQVQRPVPDGKVASEEQAGEQEAGKAAAAPPVSRRRLLRLLHAYHSQSAGSEKASRQKAVAVGPSSLMRTKIGAQNRWRRRPAAGRRSPNWPRAAAAGWRAGLGGRDVLRRRDMRRVV